MSQTPSITIATPSKATGPILRASAVSKSFLMGETQTPVLKNVDLAVQHGEFIAIEGRSGSGKSTLLHILGALDEANTGTISYEGADVSKMSGAERSALRNEHFGFVFQFYHLLPELNVMENALLGPMIQFSWTGFRKRRSELRDHAAALLKRLGMDHRLKHKPSQLSGGERQRVAMARALMNKPKILFADEPTGNLDAETSQQIMSLFDQLHAEQRQTIIMVTHDRTLARQADRALILRDGRFERSDQSA